MCSGLEKNLVLYLCSSRIGCELDVPALWMEQAFCGELGSLRERDEEEVTMGKPCREGGTS